MKSYAIAEETLICIALSEASQIYSLFIIIIVIMITIIVHIVNCHIISLWLLESERFESVTLNFAPPEPRSFDLLYRAGLGRKDGASFPGLRT